MTFYILGFHSLVLLYSPVTRAACQKGQNWPWISSAAIVLASLFSNTTPFGLFFSKTISLLWDHLTTAVGYCTSGPQYLFPHMTVDVEHSPIMCYRPKFIRVYFVYFMTIV